MEDRQQWTPEVALTSAHRRERGTKIDGAAMALRGGFLAAVVILAFLIVGGPDGVPGVLARVLAMASVCVFGVLAFRGQRAAISGLRAEVADLQEDADRDQLASRGANDGMWSWEIGRGGFVMSARWRSIVGLPAEEQHGALQEWLRRVHPQDLGGLCAELHRAALGQASQIDNTHRLLHEDQAYRWVRVRGLGARGASGIVTRVAGSMTDITERRRSERMLRHSAFHDDLTGLPNRALFLDRLGHALARSHRSAHLFGVLFLDLDGFKLVNDSLGHRLGDELLVLIARRLEAAVRPGDTVARLGGDEFIVLVDDMDQEDVAEAVADRIHDALAPVYQVEGHEVVTSVSIGIALSSTGYEAPEDLVRDADTAMYRAKAAGKAQHRVFDQGMHAQVVARLFLERDLRRALQRREFEVHYQPIVALDTGEMVAVEALVRWLHPERGLLQPGEFVGVAEDTGIITAMTGTVMRAACAELAHWRETYPCASALRVNVNVSGRQFQRTDLSSTILGILSDANVPASALRIEITETALMENADVAAQVLATLRRAGVGVCIDDFGTGYSSLAYLHRFAVDVLKIDKSFVRRLGQTETGIVQTIVNLSRYLHMTVVAEGIENKIELAALRRMGCNQGQGYLFAFPTPAKGIEDILRRGNLVLAAS